MILGCEEARISLGVYVLGAIEPAERALVDAHLGGCPGCRDELSSLAAMPALLGRVNEEQIAHLAGPPPELLESLLASAAESRGSARRGLGWINRWTPLAAAAAVLVLVGGLFGAMLTSDSDGNDVPPIDKTSSPPQARQPTGTPTKPPAEEVSAANKSTGVSAMIGVRKTRGGTLAELHLKGVPAGTSCRLDAVTRDGASDSMGSWLVTNKGYTGFYGSTMYTRDKIVAFKVVSTDGRTLLTVPATKA